MAMTVGALSNNVVAVITILGAIAFAILSFCIRRAIIRSGNQPSYFGFRSRGR
ncbi:MAG TPA: hypothetical protein VFA30_05550 [Gaiellaceae bacterium]|nr:hypothetical protein [Gaiellaceae bacterium]